MQMKWKRGSLQRRAVAHRRALLWLAVILFIAASLRTALGMPVLLIAALGLYLAYDSYWQKRVGAIAVPWQMVNLLTNKAAARNYLIGEAVAVRIPHVHPQSVLSDERGFLIMADEIPLELIGKALRSLLADRARLRRAVTPRPTLVNDTLGSMLVLAVLMTLFSLIGYLALWGLPVAVVLGKVLARRMNRPAVNLLLLFTRFRPMVVKSVSTVELGEYLGYPISPSLVGCRVELEPVREEVRLGWIEGLRTRISPTAGQPREEKTVGETAAPFHREDSQILVQDSPRLNDERSDSH